MSKYRNISDYKILRARAEEMLLNPTKSEKKLRIALLNKFPDAEFKFQVVMIPFIVDNVSIKHRLIIEVDGSIHENSFESDQSRQQNLEKDGYKFLRFTNEEIFQDLNSVLQIIEFELNQPLKIKRSKSKGKRKNRFNRMPFPRTIGDKSVIDPITNKPFESHSDSMGDNISDRIFGSISESHDELLKNRKTESNLSKSVQLFICKKCSRSIKLNESRVAFRKNNEFDGWIHKKC